MSVFIRSLSGIRNYSLFTKKEITAYCEGGTASITPEAAFSGASNTSAEDITFWETVANACAPHRSFHFKAVGDCNAVHTIADTIIANNISSACVCMDRDWREFDGSLRNDHRAVYTPDYAWENIVVRPELIAETVLSLGHLPRSHYQAILDLAANYLADLQHALRLPLYMDISSTGSGACFFEKNERCGGVISVSSGGRLAIDRKVLRIRFRRERSKYVKSISLKVSEAAVWKNIPGHILMGAAISLVQSYLRRLGLKSQSNAAIRAALLQHFRQKFTQGNWRREYDYLRSALSRVPAK